MDQRVAFIADWLRNEWTMTALAARYGVSRKTAYKWVARYDAEGIVGLVERSRRPHNSPTAVEDDVATALIAVRKRHPRWGAKKLLTVAMGEHPDTAWPSRSTVCRLLKQRGLVVRRPRRRRPPRAPRPAPVITRPNEVWTTDFKGEFRTGNHVYCYPLTLRDGFSRFVLRCDALASPTYEATRRRFERAFAEYGLPDRIRSDNGSPFASTGLGRLSRLSVWWIRLGIVPERIAPGHPEQDGSHEQFHSVLKAETARPPAANAAAQQRRFVRFRAEYNHERPHEALHDCPPASCYQPSVRSLPSRLPPIQYDGHLEIRRVSEIGQVSWRGHFYFVSSALAREDVAFEEVGDGLWTVSFAHVILGRVDERQRRIHPIAPFTEGRSAASPPRA